VTDVYRVWMRVAVDVTIDDPDVIARVVDNHDDEGTPQPVGRGNGANGWHDTYYNIPDRDGVLHHLAFNGLVNGADDVTRLDGWADMGPDACTMTVRRRTIEYETPEVIG
jgi:hypothetical protein